MSRRREWVCTFGQVCLAGLLSGCTATPSASSSPTTRAQQPSVSGREEPSPEPASPRAAAPTPKTALGEAADDATAPPGETAPDAAARGEAPRVDAAEGPWGQHSWVELLRAGDGHVVALIGRKEHIESWHREADGSWRAGVSASRDGLSGEARGAFGARLLLAGGEARSRRVSDRARVYDASEDRWEPAASLPAGTIQPRVTGLASGGWVLTGGEVPDGDNLPRGSDAVLILRPGGSAWTRLAALPSPRYGHAAVELADGDLLVVGGDDGGSEARFDDGQPYGVALAQRLDLKAGAWRGAGTMPDASAYLGALRLRDGRVLLFGGTVAPIGRMSKIPTLWAPRSQRFTQLPAIDAGDGELTALPDGRVLLSGGSVLKTDGAIPFSVATTHLFDPTRKRDAWRAGPSLSPGRAGHRAIALSSSEVLLVGGESFDWDEERGQDIEPTWPPPQVVRVD